MKLRLGILLEERGIKSTEFKNRIGVTQPYMSNLINNKCIPSLPLLERMAKSLNVEIWELFTPSLSKQTLTALIDYKGDLYKANTIEDLEKIVEKIKKEENE
ncbi:MAG: helix-turn-helix domain-containing protein [Candidatus Azobacteroides sp.]|nr:helix-turn-helix domain-containing protein [Candidatus Azobacteroides sp.]